MNELRVNSDKYFAAYDAACSLAVIVEFLESDLPIRKGGAMLEEAKGKLRRLAEVEGSGFFTRFEGAAKE